MGGPRQTSCPRARRDAPRRLIAAAAASFTMLKDVQPRTDLTPQAAPLQFHPEGQRPRESATSSAAPSTQDSQSAFIALPSQQVLHGLSTLPVVPPTHL